MKKLVLCILSLIMLLAMVACDSEEVTPTTQATQSAETTLAPTQVPETTVATEETASVPAGPAIAQFSMSWMNGEDFGSISAFPNEDGTIRVDYQGDIRKVADMDATVMQTITDCARECALSDLDGLSQYLEGPVSCNLFVFFEDESGIFAETTGISLDPAFETAYAAMETCFRELMAEVPEYVPTPQISGQPDAALREELVALLEASGLEPLDMFQIMDVPMDENFAYTMGMKTADGVITGAACGYMMMPTPFSMNMVNRDPNADKDAVCQSFRDGINWQYWVCVQPEMACIATKGELTVCLLGSGDFFAKAAAALTERGWQTEVTLENPNLS